MSSRRSFLDVIDKKILNELQYDCRIPLGKLAEKLQVSLSTIHYRIKRLEEEKIILGYHAHIDLSQLSDIFQTALLISAKYSEQNIEKLSELLKSIDEVWAVYFVLGSQNFIVLAKTTDNHTFMERIFKLIINSNTIDNMETLVISKIIKEEQKIIFNEQDLIQLA